MARFAAKANGDIHQLVATWQQEKITVVPPLTEYTLWFDEATNQGIINAFNLNSAAFRMDGGTLTQSGTPATINLPSLFYQAFTDRAGLLAKANAQNSPFTTQEIAQLLGVVFRVAGLE